MRIVGNFSKKITRSIQYTLCVTLSSSLLVGCGFVDVSSLQATPGKQGVAILATPTVLEQQTVIHAVADAPSGIVVQSFAYPSEEKVAEQLLASGSISTVVFDNLTYTGRAWAARYPKIHFFIVGQPPAASTVNVLSNVTWLTPSVTAQAAAYAGYLVGGLLKVKGGGVIAAVYDGQTALAAQDTATLLAAVSSGLHAAFSNAMIVPVSANQKLPVTYAGSATINLTSTPITGLSVGNTVNLLAGSDTGVVADLPAGTAFSAGLHAVWRLQSTAQTPAPTVQPVFLPLPTLHASYRGWQGVKGIQLFANALQSGKITPDAFLQSVPTVTIAKRFGLPVYP